MAHQDGVLWMKRFSVRQQTGRGLIDEMFDKRAIQRRKSMMTFRAIAVADVDRPVNADIRQNTTARHGWSRSSKKAKGDCVQVA